jgi:hypothetical protein
MVTFLLFLFLSVVFAEGATELICKSLFFAPLRKNIFEASAFLKSLLSCGYCTSVWVATLPAAVLSFWYVGVSFLTAPVFLGLTVIIHRLSNRFHDFGDKWLDKYYDKRYQDSQDKSNLS